MGNHYLEVLGILVLPQRLISRAISEKFEKYCLCRADSFSRSHTTEWFWHLQNSKTVFKLPEQEMNIYVEDLKTLVLSQIYVPNAISVNFENYCFSKTYQFARSHSQEWLWLLLCMDHLRFARIASREPRFSSS